MKEKDVGRQIVDLALPWEVMISENERHGPLGRKGRIGTTKRWRDSLQAMRLLIQRRAKHVEGLPWTGGIEYEARVTYPDRRRRDLGNLRKAVEDAMEGIVYEDDAQIVGYSWRLEGIGDGAGCRLWVRRVRP